MKPKQCVLVICLCLAVYALSGWTSVLAGEDLLPITAENMSTLKKVTTQLDYLYQSNIIYDPKLELLITNFLPKLKAQRISPDELLPNLPASANILGVIVEPNKMNLLVRQEELLQLWNAADGTKTTLANDVKDRHINSEISSDGTLVAFTSLKICGDECIVNDALSKKVFIWNILTEELFTIDIPDLVAWSTFNNRNDLILGIGDHQNLQIWEAPVFTTKQDIFAQDLFFGGAEPVDLAKMTDWLAFFGNDNVHIYQLATQTEQILDLDASQQEYFSQLVFSPNGQMLGIIKHYDDKNALLYLVKLEANQWTYVGKTPLELDVDVVRSMAFSPDNRLVALGSLTGQLIVYDLATMNSQTRTIADNEPVWDIAFTEDQTYLVLWSGYQGNGKFSVWGIDRKNRFVAGRE